MALRDDAIRTLAQSGAPAVLSTAGMALGLPALRAAGAGLAALPPLQEVTGRGRRAPVRDADLDFLSSLDTDIADEDLFADIDTALAAPAPAPAMPTVPTEGEGIPLPEEAEPTADVKAPGTFLPVRTMRPLEKLAGVATGLAQSAADIPLAMMAPGPESKGAAGEAYRRLAASKGEVQQAIKDVVAERQPKAFTTTAGEDLYDLMAAFPRLGLSLVEEVPEGQDAFESARKAAYGVLPGVAAQVETMATQPAEYAYAMPVSTAADLLPGLRAIRMAGKGGKAGARIDRYLAAERKAQEAEDALQGGYFYTDPDLPEGTMIDLGPQGDKVVSDLGDVLAERDAGRAAGIDLRRESFERPSRRFPGLARWVSDAGAQATEGYELIADMLNRPQDVYPSAVVGKADVDRLRAAEKIDEYAGPTAARDEFTVDRLAELKQSPTFTKEYNRALGRGLDQFKAAQEAIRTTRNRRAIVAELATVEGGAAAEVTRQVRARMITGDKPPVPAPEPPPPKRRGKRKIELAPDDRMAPDLEEPRYGGGMQAIQQQFPPAELAVPPPRLRAILGDEAIDAGVLDSLSQLAPIVDPDNPAMQINNLVKANLTVGNPSSILNNFASNVLLQAFRRGPLSLPFAAGRAVAHTLAASKLDDTTRAALGLDKLADYDRTYEILHDLQILDRDALTAEIQTQGLNRVMDTISKVGTLGDALPMLFRAGDRVFKLEETIHNLDKYRSYLDEMAPGSFVEFRMTPKFTLRVDRDADGALQGKVYTARGLPTTKKTFPVSTDLASVSPELVRAAAQPALDAFFDYTDLPKYPQLIKQIPMLGIASPFMIWAYKAMDLPGKRGLGYEVALAPSSIVRTNSPSVRLAEARIGAARTLGRVAILEAAHRELLQDSPEGKQLAEAIAFNPKEPRTAIVRMITDPTNKDLGTNYAYTLQAGNWNFLSPTDKVMRLATWGLTHALTDQEGMRDTMRALRDPALPAQERLAAQRKLDTMMRVYSGKVADFGDVLSFMQFGGGPLLDWYEKATSDEQAGKSITIGDIAGEVSKAAGAPALALRAYANANPESDWASAFRDKSREVVVPDANLRESFGRVMARRLLGVAWRTLPLETIDTPQGKSYGTIDSYFQRLTKELEVSTGTEAKTIEAMQTKASQLAANGKQEEAAALQAKVDARMELRAMLFGLPADPRTGMPAVEGEVDRAKRELYDVLDRTRPAPRQRTDK